MNQYNYYTKSYETWAEQTQAIFDFSVLVHYSVPALKNQINLVERGVVTSLSRPDYYRSYRQGAYSDEELLKSLKTRASNYKSHICEYLLLTLFSYFEAYIIDVFEELIQFQKGYSYFQSLAITKSKDSMQKAYADKHLRKSINDLKPIRRKNKPDKRQALEILNKNNIRLPFEHFSAYGIFAIGQKIKDLKSKDIPEILMNVLLIDLTAEEIESFHKIRNLRNNIAHGRKVNLDVKSVTEKNKTLTKLAKKVDLHITNHFMISQI